MDVRRLRMIERDGVHLNSCSNRVAAVALYHRKKEMVNEVEKQRRLLLDDRMKRRRMT